MCAQPRWKAMAGSASSRLNTTSKSSTRSRTTARWDGDGNDGPFLRIELLLQLPHPPERARLDAAATLARPLCRVPSIDERSGRQESRRARAPRTPFLDIE